MTLLIKEKGGKTIRIIKDQWLVPRVGEWLEFKDGKITKSRRIMNVSYSLDDEFITISI